MFEKLYEQINELHEQALNLSKSVGDLDIVAQRTAELVQHSQHANHETISPFVFGLTVFVLAVFVGYYVVWKVTPALHSPLMAVTNAISSVIIVGALLAAGLSTFGFAKILGFLAVMLASVNIFGGFIVTQRMLQMFMKKK